jgi:hypothetical protein
MDVSNHLTALNPDVPDFQPGKMWKNENESKKGIILSSKFIYLNM